MAGLGKARLGRRSGGNRVSSRPFRHPIGCPATIFIAAAYDRAAFPRHQYPALLDQSSSGGSIKTGSGYRLAGADEDALSVQVLQEFYVQATQSTRSDPLPHGIAAGLTTTWTRFRVQEITLLILTGAPEIKAAHGFSYWDSAIIAAARALGCRALYTEDMGHGRKVDGVTIINPFQSEYICRGRWLVADKHQYRTGRRLFRRIATSASARTVAAACLGQRWNRLIRQ
jgi:predicted nucleic acid-binding protein